MCAERLHFQPGQMDYNAMLAAEHVGRYLFAAPHCAGKRVLDVACGEGYGAFMLARCGAAEVVGVDIAEDAIAVARQRFARDGVEFLVGDALDLPGLLGGRPPFDVIVSFETIEHVPDPRRFLEGIRRVLAPGGVILVSCPNDGLEAERGITNPFHARTYTLAEFQEMTSGVLGPPARWYLGTPLQGIIIAEASSWTLHNDSRDLSLLVDALEAASGHLLPAQPDMRVTPETCTFYLGVWGTAGDAVHVAAPISRKALLEPWWALEWFKAERARDAEALQRAKQHVAFLEEQIRELRRASVAERRRLASQGEAMARLREIESSRGYRLLQRYYALTGSPGIGPVIRGMRSAAKWLIRRRYPGLRT